MIYFKSLDMIRKIFFDMIMETLEVNKFKYYLYLFFGRILMIGTIVLSILLKQP